MNTLHDRARFQSRRTGRWAGRRSGPRCRPTFEELQRLTLLSGSLSGTIWNDRDGDGVFQPDEPGQLGTTVFLDLNRNGALDGDSRTVAAPSTTITPAPGALGSFGGFGSTLVAQGLPTRLLDVNVHLDLANHGTGPVTVGLVSPLGLVVPNLPTLFAIQPGEHFNGTFDGDAAAPVTLAPRPLVSGTYRPQQFFTDPQAHIYDGDPNGTWGLIFFGETSGLELSSWSLTFTVPEPSARTDDSGRYVFTDLSPGGYLVTPVLGPADVLTLPAVPNRSRNVQVGVGLDTSGVDFGVRPGPDLLALSLDLEAPATAWGQTVTAHYTITNQAPGDAGPFDLHLRLGPNGIISDTGPPLQVLHVSGLAGHASQSGSMTINLPNAPPPGLSALGDAFLGLIVDPENAVAENDEANNHGQGDGIDLTPLAAQPNQVVASGIGAQQMPSVAVNPLDANHVVIAYMDNALVSSGYAGIGVAVSHDGGASFQRTALALPADFAGGAAGPVVRFDREGRVFVSMMAATFLGPRKPALTNPASAERLLGFQSNNGIFVARSDDGGVTWNAPVPVVSHLYTGPDVLFEIAPDFDVDTFPTLPDGRPNPNYGNLYVSWVRLYPAGRFPGQPSSTGGSDVMVAVSRDGGLTWATQMQVQPGSGLSVSAIKDPDFGDNATSAPGRGFSFYPHVSVGPEGDVYVSTFGAGDFTIFHSTDGGAHFRAPDRANQLGVAFTAVLPFPTLFADSFRTISARAIVADPSRPGHVYATEANSVFNYLLGGFIDAGEIIFARSDDYGQTWQRVFQVGPNPSNLLDLDPDQRDVFLSALNDENQGRFLGFTTQLDQEAIAGQALPRMTIDAQGNLQVIWYDTRRDPALHLIDVYGAQSTDGGKTFTANFRVTDATFDPDEGAFIDALGQTNFYLGDAIGVASSNGTAYAVWTDTRAGSQDIVLRRYHVAAAPAPLGDRLEPNDAPEAQTELGVVAVQQVVPRLTLTPADEDWFRLQTAATGNLIVSALTDGGGPVEIDLLDGNGNVLPALAADVRDGSGFIVGRQLVAPSVAGQDYRVRVRGAGTSTATYSLVLGSLTADLGVVVEGRRSGTLALGDQAVYRLVAGVDGTLAVTLGADAATQGGIAFAVLDADGQEVLASGPAEGVAAGASQRIQIPVKRGQVVLIRVSAATPDAHGGYSLRYTNLDQFQTPGAASLFFPTSGAPSSIAVAQLNGDGRPDLVVTSTDLSDPLNVLLGNGDGTFKAARRFDVGPGLSGTLTAGYREPVLVDLNHDLVLDVVVPNFRSADLSVLLGNGDGTFQPQRRFDALPSPDSMTAGDFNGDGHVDLVVLQNFPQLGGVSRFAVLLGRGDGTFQPALQQDTVFTRGAFPIRAGDFDADGHLDLIAFSKNEAKAHLFLGNGDGTFLDSGTFATGENVYEAQVVDLDGDGSLDLITTGTNNGNVYVMLGAGDGTFAAPKAYLALAPSPGDNVGVLGLAVVDFGGLTTKGTGPADGRLDIVVTAASRSGAGPAQVVLLAGLVDASGHFAGLGAPVTLAEAAKPGKLASGDLNQDQAIDLMVADGGGAHVIFGKPVTVIENKTPETARDLGSVTHLVTSPQAITARHWDAYYTLTVPVDPALGTGGQVVDISAYLENLAGPRLQMAVFDTTGNRLADGERIRLLADQGQELLVHVYGPEAGDGTRGSGVYTLDINVLPQVVSAQALSALPGGPATSIVLTLQGDRLDPSTATVPENYVVTWLGADGAPGTPDDQVIPLAATDAVPAVFYNPNANTGVASGLTYLRSARQTITLLFPAPLPPGSYQIDLAPKIQVASLDRPTLLAGDDSLGGHPVVSVEGPNVLPGSRFLAPFLVSPSTSALDPGAINHGTPFLTQLQNDLATMLDRMITRSGDDPAISSLINQHILDRFLPALQGAAPSQSFLIIWLDPVSIDLQAPGGQAVSYNLASNQVANNASQTFVSVGGNVEVIVVANVAGTFQLDVSNVPASARGGQVTLTALSSSSSSFTDALRSGDTSFELAVGGGSNGGSPTPGEDGGGQAPTDGDGNGSGAGPSGNASAAGTAQLVSISAPGGASSTGSFGTLATQLIAALATGLIAGPSGVSQGTTSGPSAAGSSPEEGQTAEAASTESTLELGASLSRLVRELLDSVDEVLEDWEIAEEVSPLARALSRWYLPVLSRLADVVDDIDWNEASPLTGTQQMPQADHSPPSNGAGDDAPPNEEDEEGAPPPDQNDEQPDCAGLLEAGGATNPTRADEQAPSARQAGWAVVLLAPPVLSCLTAPATRKPTWRRRPGPSAWPLRKR